MSKELEALSALRSTINLVDYQDSGQYYDKMKWLNTIEQALKRNEPMKVKEALICDDPRIIVHHCPNCDKELFKTDISYCPCCGQKLDWRNNYE